MGPTGEGGSGMFYFASRSEGRLTLKPDPHWWGVSAGKRPHFTELDIHLYGSQIPNLDYQGFLQSPYDYADGPPNDSLALPEQHPVFHLVPALEFVSIAFSWVLAPLDNADARQALCLAINRDAVAQQLLQHQSVNTGGVPKIPSWHLVPQGTPGYDPSLTGIAGVSTSGDLGKAEAHWRACLASLDGKPVPPVAHYYEGGVSSIVADTLTAQWSAAFPGLKSVARDLFPGAPLVPLTAADLQVSALGWFADYPIRRISCRSCSLRMEHSTRSTPACRAPTP